MVSPFFRVATYHTKMAATFALSNGSSGVDPACKARALSTGGAAVDCLFAENVAPHIQTPLFALEGQYDSWQLGNILELAGR